MIKKITQFFNKLIGEGCLYCHDTHIGEVNGRYYCVDANCKRKAMYDSIYAK